MTPKAQTIPYVNPRSQAPLRCAGDCFVDEFTGELVGRISGRIPRFVAQDDNYAESFGWQWKHWAHNQSESRGAAVKQRELILERTHFGEYDLGGKTLLECGMGGGDDTEVLLTFPFSEIHAFDLSSAVERGHRYLNDGRLFVAQASIDAMPYPDGAFDVVFCHRVLQHTPEPERSLRAICRKVKPHGILFVHSYKRSAEHMSEWRYKYRPLTTRLPASAVYFYVKYLGWSLHHVVTLLHRCGGPGARLAHQYVPFYWAQRGGPIAGMGKRELIEYERMITFDALTPKYDSPMSSERLREILAEEGFTIEHFEDRWSSPVYATARRDAEALERRDA